MPWAVVVCAAGVLLYLGWSDPRIIDRHRSDDPVPRESLSSPTAAREAADSLFGRCVDVIAARPVSGAVVTLAEAATISDKDGRFVIPREQGANTLSIVAEGFEPANVAAPERPTADLGAVLLIPCRRISGSVSDSRGQPVVAATIEMFVAGEIVAAGQSAEDGGFHLPVTEETSMRLCARDATSVVTAHAPGLAPAATAVEHCNEPVKLVLRDGSTRRGVVYDAATGAPLPDVAVRMQPRPQLRAGDGVLLATTDADGRFEATGTGITGWHLVLKRAGYAPAVVPTPGDDRAVIVRLHRTATVHGHVVTQQGVPVSDAWVRTVPALPSGNLAAANESERMRAKRAGRLSVEREDSQPVYVSTFTGPDGSFALADVPADGVLHVVAQKQVMSKAVTFPEVPTETVTLELALASDQASIGIQVVDEAGRPVPSSTVTRFVRAAADKATAQSASVGRTNRDGLTELCSWRTLTYPVWIRADAESRTGLAGPIMLVESFGSTITIAVRPSTTLVGNIEGLADPRGVRIDHWRLLDEDLWERGRPTSPRGDGGFSLLNLPPGTYEILFTGPDVAPRRERVAIAGTVDRHDMGSVHLGPGRVLRGHVRRTGTPVGLAAVGCEPSAEWRLWAEVGPTWTVADAEGAFVLRGITPGDVTLVVIDRMGDPTTHRFPCLGDAQSMDVELPARPARK
ncbi:MAG TPA: carboxypeptidase-like regulatory domain-containing protein [Planctomycetota bacterium]|nr:carboxypeptidase-like regulatory domain-containing protein [Planctomycetota bacterium]